jgi:hypothetical protein
MVFFQTKNPHLGKFWRALEWKMLVYIIHAHLEYITAIWYMLWSFGNFVEIWTIFSTFGRIASRKIWQPCSEMVTKVDRIVSPRPTFLNAVTIIKENLLLKVISISLAGLPDFS